MPKLSAGLLLFRRRREDGPEVLLGHMGGPFWAGKEQSAWSIPKGLPLPGEDLLAAARREVKEETGLEPSGPFLPLRPIQQAGGKEVHAWAAETDCDPATLRSNHFRVEWPPRSGRWQSFPELDRVAWLTLPEARDRIVRGQVALLEQLEDVIAGNRTERKDGRQAG
jgi:predicted NUDIX family NTP pyrophosphohydrolase